MFCSWESIALQFAISPCTKFVVSVTPLEALNVIEPLPPKPIPIPPGVPDPVIVAPSWPCPPIVQFVLVEFIP